MDTQKLAAAARAMVADGKAEDLDEAIKIVTEKALHAVAGHYTPQSLRNWIADVKHVEQATRG